MTRWKTWELGDLVAAAGGHIKTGPFGSQLHAREYTDDPHGIPVVMPRDMCGGRIDHGSVSRVDRQTAERLSTHRLAAGDIVLARRGDVGRFGYVADDEAGWLCGTGSMRIHAPDSDVISHGYLRYALSHPSIGEWLTGQAVGATMPNLNAAIVARLPVSIPPVASQRRVAAVLDAFDSLVAINARRIALLEELARSLYREWFERFRFAGFEATEFVSSALGPIPEDWDVRTLADLVTTQYGFTASAQTHGTGPKFLRGMDINKTSFIDWAAVPHCQIDARQRARFTLEVGDICLIRMADPGKVGIIETRVDAVFASYLVRIRSTDPRLPAYLLFHYFDSPTYQDWVNGSSTGSTRKSASAAVLAEPQIAVPSVEVASLFDSKASSIRAQLTALVKIVAELTKTRNLLLPRLVSGRLDVSRLDLGGLLSSSTA